VRGTTTTSCARSARTPTSTASTTSSSSWSAGRNLSANVERLAVKGRIAVIGTGAGARAEIDFGLLMRKRGRIHGSTLRARTREEKEDVVRRLEGHALHLLASGLVHVPVEETFLLEQAQEAYERFAAGGKFGKIVICP